MKLNFTIAEEPVQLQTHRIVDLCDYLTAKVLEPMFQANGWKWNRRFMNFFTFDNACDPLEATGTILFTIPPLFAGQTGQLEEAIKRELGKLKIKSAPFRYERNPVTAAVRVLTIPIVENPTVLVTPPEVNMSYTRGCLVLRDLLGYQKVNDRYEFLADDLLKRVTMVTEDRIAACTASPTWDPKMPAEVKRTPSRSARVP